jgi:uncharacterized protein (DUF1800 family)
VIDIIMQQPVTADYIAGKIYRFFVRQDLSPELQKQLGKVLREIALRNRAAARNHLPLARFLQSRFGGHADQEPGGTRRIHL